MTLDPQYITRIEEMVEKVHEFMDLGLDTVIDQQIKGDLKYLEAVCKNDGLDVQPYKLYYIRKLRCQV